MTQSEVIQFLQNKQHVCVILLNMGGPRDVNSIKPFLYNLFNDKDLIKLPFPVSLLQKPIAKLITKIRYTNTKNMYEQIGGGSPILKITENLAKNMENEFNRMGYNTTVRVAMRYSTPRISELISGLNIESLDKIILFSQYPHYAKATTGSSIKEFYKQISKLDTDHLEIIEIKDWSNEPEYISWWINGIREELEKLQNDGIVLDKNVHVIFSVHGLPQSYIKHGEQYPLLIEGAKNLIIDQLGEIANKVTFHLAYQSRAGPFPWLQPYTNELIKELSIKQVKALVMVPLGFVTDHVETKYEIDILYADLAKNLGIPRYSRIGVPNADQKYSKDIVQMVIRLSGLEDEL